MSSEVKKPDVDVIQTGASEPSTRNKTGIGIVGGLVLSGVVIGSCAALAVYVDYRLNSVERLIGQQTQEVSGTLDSHTASLRTEIGDGRKEFKEHASILAKGIVDLTEQERTHHTNLLEQVIGFEGIIDEKQKEINAVLVAHQEIGQQQLQTLFDDYTSGLAEQNNSIVSALTQVQSGQIHLQDEVSAAVRGMDGRLEETRQSIVRAVNVSKESLAELIQLADQSQQGRLAELASEFAGLADDESSESLAMKSDIQRLAVQIDNLKKNVESAESAAHELKSMIPSMRDENDALLEATSEALQARMSDLVREQFALQVNALNERIEGLYASLDQTSQSLLKAMFMTNENMDDIRIEVKSGLTMGRQETADQLHSLARTVLSISEELQRLTVAADRQAASALESSSVCPAQMELYQNAIHGLVGKMTSLRTLLDEHVNAALLEGQPLADSPSDDLPPLSRVMRQVEQLAGEIDEQLAELSRDIRLLSHASVDKEAASTEEETAPTVDSAQETASAQARNPEKRGEELGVALYE